MAPMVAPPAPAQETSRQAAGQAPDIGGRARFTDRRFCQPPRPFCGAPERDRRAAFEQDAEPPQPGSIHEAAMVLGIVKTFSPINIETNTFNEQELSDGKTSS